MPPEISYDPDAVAFTVDGQQRVSVSRDDAVVAPLDALADVRVSDFERVLDEYEEHDAANAGVVFLCDVAEDEFDPDMSHRDLALSFLAGRLDAEAGRGLDPAGGTFDGAALLDPLLVRHDAELTGSYTDEQGGHVSEVFSLRLRGEERTVGELFALGREAQALLDAADANGAVSAVTARDLVAAGRAAVLLGQPESRWLDAKSQPHSLDSDAAKWEFAKDVAAFANTGREALIVYGIETSRERTGDVLGTLRAFELSDFDAVAARAVLAERLTPVIPDVDIGLVEARAGYGYGWVFVPAQPPEMLPLMVTGVLVGDRVQGAHVSVPVRVGEDTTHWDASLIHSLVQAGRVALRSV